MSNCYSKHDTCIIQWNCSKIWPAVFKLHASYLLKEIRKLLSRSKVKVLRHRNLTTSVVQTQQHMFTPRFHRFCLDRQTDRQKHTDIHPQTHRQRDTERETHRHHHTDDIRNEYQFVICVMLTHSLHVRCISCGRPLDLTSSPQAEKLSCYDYL